MRVMRDSLYVILVCMVAMMHAYQMIEEKPIVVVVTSYNNKDWYQLNLNSIFVQQYSNYRVIYIDDLSTDGTGKLVEDYIKERGQEDRVRLIHNTQRLLAGANHDYAIRSCKDDEIVIILNGDDWFAHDGVLYFINRIYADPNIWLTYGQYQVYPSGQLGHCCAMPEDIIKNNAFRTYISTPSHLRTFYAGLYKQIKIDDLLYEGEYLKMTEDLAMMYPMMEMARDGHFKFVPDILLTYNNANVLNDHKVSRQLQKDMDTFIRSKKPYDRVKKPFKSYSH